MKNEIVLLIVFIVSIIFAFALANYLNSATRPYEMDQKFLDGEITHDEYCVYFENSTRPPLECYQI